MTSRISSAGWHDVYVRWDISTPEAVVGRLQSLPGTGDLVKGRKLLAERGRFGGWDHLLGDRHVLLTYSGKHAASRGGGVWRRLELQAHLGPPGEDDLCAVADFDGRWLGLQSRLAMHGVLPASEGGVVRCDAAVDVEFDRVEDGWLVLEALRFARWPNGWYAEWAGPPPYTTVNIKHGTSTVARVYCRNTKLKNDRARWGKLRFEVEHRRTWAHRWPVLRLGEQVFAQVVWEYVFGAGEASGQVTRIEREVQTVTLIERVKLGELTYSQFERMTAFLDAERLGLVDSVYTADQGRARRREARQLGLTSADTEYPEFDVALDELLELPRSAFAA